MDIKYARSIKFKYHWIYPWPEFGAEDRDTPSVLNTYNVYIPKTDNGDEGFQNFTKFEHSPILWQGNFSTADTIFEVT